MTVDTRTPDEFTVSQESKRHHYIPEFFLRRWCIGGKLTRYVKIRRGIWAKEYAPKAVAFRTDLYKLRGIGVANPQGIETNFFQKFDSDASLVIAKLLPGGYSDYTKGARNAGLVRVGAPGSESLIDRAQRGDRAQCAPLGIERRS